MKMDFVVSNIAGDAICKLISDFNAARHCIIDALINALAMLLELTFYLELRK